MKRVACGWPEIREAGESKGEMDWRECRGRGLTSYQNQREQRTGAQIQREGWIGTPGVGRKAGLDPRVRGRRGLNPRIESWDPIPEGRGAGPTPGWGHAGQGAEGSAQAVLRRPRYIRVQSPGPPHSPSSDHGLPSLYRHASPPTYPWPWHCSRDPSVPPASLRAHRACALRSCRLKSRA